MRSVASRAIYIRPRPVLYIERVGMIVLRQPQDRSKSETSFPYLTTLSDPKQFGLKGKKIKKAAKKSLQTTLHG